MNILQLSLRCLCRKKVRSVLLFLIVFVAAVFIYAGYACQSASVQTQDAGRQSVGASFRLEANDANRSRRIEELAAKLDQKVGKDQAGSLGGYFREQLSTGAWFTGTDNSFETLDRKDIEKIAETKGLCAYNITTANTVVNPVHFARIEDKDRDQSSDLKGVSLRGNRDMAYDFDVQKGNIVVNEGRMTGKDDKDACVISRELAELNHFQVGDMLEFNDRREPDSSTVYAAEIVGIYDTIQKMEPIMDGDSFRSENIIFTDLSFPEKAEGCENNPLYQTASFWVENVDDYETVKKAVRKTNIDWEKYDLLDHTGMSDTMTENFGDLKEMSVLLLCLVLASSVLILLFVFLYWIKTRICEIGILLSLGRKKEGIVLQMMLEGLLIGAVSFLLATAVAPYVSNAAADYLVGNQIEQERQKEKLEMGMVSTSGGESKEEVLGVSVRIDARVMAFTAFSVIGMIVVSVGLSGLSVAVRKPKEILTKM